MSAQEIAAGVPLELVGRLVVLLHLAEPGEEGAPDALGMVGTSAGLQRVRRHIEQVADLSVPVLIRGETGSGKELIAQALHQCGARRGKAFVSVNLGAIPKELAAAELFGARKGAFTGAVRDQKVLAPSPYSHLCRLTRTLGGGLTLATWWLLLSSYRPCSPRGDCLGHWPPHSLMGSPLLRVPLINQRSSFGSPRYHPGLSVTVKNSPSLRSIGRQLSAGRST